LVGWPWFWLPSPEVSITFYKPTVLAFLALIVPLLLVMQGCAAPPLVAVEERDVLTTRQEVEPYGGQLIRFVQPGDTLHGIAFAYGLNINKLAVWNGLDENQKILVGQRIRLTEPIGFKPPVAKSNPAPSQQSAQPVTQQSNQRPSQTQTSSNSEVARPQSIPRQPPTGERVPPPTNQTVGADKWRWPLRGSLLQRFQPNRGQQGIVIQSQQGQPIKTARSGQVVYSGSSLKGYGHLIIVKHDDLFLSAYAHTQNALVKEGQMVRNGEPIAQIGRDKSGRAALHFQIRLEGTPIDPLSKLPRG